MTRKVDGFFARVADRHGTDMQCSTGCSDCCHVRLTITAVEAAAIRDHVASWSSQDLRNLAEPGPGGPAPAPGDRCAALDPTGRCKIYDARPLVCRSHGVPIRLRRGALPVVQACHRNFRGTVPDPDCILDQTTLSAMLLAVDVAERPGAPTRAHPHDNENGHGHGHGQAQAQAQAQAGPPDSSGQRVELAQLLADLAAI